MATPVDSIVPNCSLNKKPGVWFLMAMQPCCIWRNLPMSPSATGAAFFGNVTVTVFSLAQSVSAMSMSTERLLPSYA